LDCREHRLKKKSKRQQNVQPVHQNPIKKHAMGSTSVPTWYSGTSDEWKLLSKPAKQVAYRKAHPGKSTSYQAKYRSKNKTAIATSGKLYRDANPSKEAARCKKYRDKNPEKQADRHKKYRDNQQREFNNLFGVGSIIN
jgi:hypothetical protein